MAAPTVVHILLALRYGFDSGLKLTSGIQIPNSVVVATVTQ